MSTAAVRTTAFLCRKTGTFHTVLSKQTETNSRDKEHLRTLYHFFAANGECDVRELVSVKRQSADQIILGARA